MAGDPICFLLVDSEDVGASCHLQLQMSLRLAVTLANAILVSAEGILSDQEQGEPIEGRTITINAAARHEVAVLDMDRS